MMMFLRHRLMTLMLAVSLCGWPLVMSASQLRISPLLLTLSSEQPAAVLTLSNEGRATVTVQVRLFAWQQDAVAGLLLEPTQDVVLSPAIVTLAPSSTQLVRVQARTPAVQKEQYYRLLIDQLPDAASASRDRIRVLTRYSLPVFVEPRVRGLPNVTAKLVACAANGGLQLHVFNNGSKRARLSDWQLHHQNKTLAAHIGLAGYALAGQVTSLPLTSVSANQLANVSTSLLWQVNTDVGLLSVPVSITAEPVSCTAADITE